MGQYRYIGGEARYYPGLGIEAEPGSVHTLRKAPDDRFVFIKPPATSKSGRQRATPAPATTAPATPSEPATAAPTDPSPQE